MKRCKTYPMIMLTAALLAFTCTGATAVSAAGTAPSLQEAGAIEDPDGNLRFSYGLNGVLYTEKEDMYQLCSDLGAEVEGAAYADIDEVTDGYYVARREEDGMIQSCLIKEDGTVLIPYGPALIDQLSDRFLKVVYAEEVTENEDEAIIYFTSQMLSLGPEEDDVLYKGYLLVYDLEGERFLDNLRVTSGYTNLYATDETVFVQDYEGTPALYDGDGTVINDDMSGVTRVGSFFSKWQDGMTIVYSDRMERLFETTLQLSGIESRKDCLSYYEDGKYGVLGTDGSILIPASYEYPLRDGGENLIFDDDTRKGIVKPDGTVLAEDAFDYISFENGYYVAYYPDGDNDVLISSDGTVYSNIEGSIPDTLVSIRTGEESYSVYVIEDGDYTLELADASPAGLHLVRGRDSASGKYGLFETVTGTQLLDYEYSAIETAYGKLYAYKDGIYTVFEAN